MAKTRRKISVCPNCYRGLLAAENYCPECGQENTNKNVSLKIFFKDFADEFLNFDSRFFKTCRPFLFKPGFLTMEYNAGRRKLYLSPLRLYLICSFLYFVIPAPDLSNIAKTLQSEKVDTVFSKESQNIDTNSTIPDSLKKNPSHFSLNRNNKGMSIVVMGNTLNQKFTDTQKDSIVTRIMDSLNLDKTTIIGQLLMRGGNNILDMIDDGGKAFIQKLKDNTPGMVFCLLPLFALLMKFIYQKKKIFYLECVIFSLHFHSFLFLMFMMDDMLMYTGVNAVFIGFVEFFWSLCYFYFSLKRYFQEKFLTIAWKLCFIGIGYSVAFIFTGIITIAVTLLMY